MSEKLITIDASNIRLSADAISMALDRQIEDGSITDSDKALVLWLFGDCKRKAMSMQDIGKAIGYDASSVSRIFRGRYEGSIDNVIKAIRRYKHLIEERGKMMRADFVDTSIWRKIRSTCDLALIHQMPATIIGPSQIGKTAALLEYQRRSEYLVRYVRMPAAPGFRCAMEAIADACFVTSRCSAEQLRRRVAKSLDSKTLLIIDELHQLAISAGKLAAMKIMEWIRELHDISGCGLVCCGTRIMSDDLFGGELKGWLDQFLQRCIRRLSLPDRLPDEDIIAVGNAYQLPEPIHEQLAQLRELRMNRLIKTIMLSGNLAEKKSIDLTWELVLKTLATLNK